MSDNRAGYARTLETDVQFLKGVGPRVALSLNKLGLKTVRDVLFHLPRRYEDRRNIPKIKDVRPGDWVTVKGRLTGFSGRPTRGGMVILKAGVSDGTAEISLVWFNQPWVRKKLQNHQGEIIAYGQVKAADWALEINSPEFELIEPDDDPEDFAKIIPVYPLTEGVFQKTVRRAAASAVQNYVDLVEDPLPPALLKKMGLKGVQWCLRQIHGPDSEQTRLEARKRLVFEEFFLLQLALAMRRAETQQETGIAFPVSALDGPLWDEIHKMLPFELTGAQRRVIGEIFSDMETPHPMNRLVQGDVGSGKTAVAAAAMLAAVRGGYQAALMAPTEILAEQHHAILQRLFDPLGIHVTLLVGKMTAREKQRARNLTSTGQTRIAVGTHALVQEGVEFESLGLAVIDEQHRFGVLQRAALREKGLGNPDVLVMTATPIPRTLTMTLYGDLDLSVIDEMPPGRRPIRTHWKLSGERDAVYRSLRKLIDEGRQAYVVCPMVSESEKMLAQAAEELHRQLSAETFPDLRVGLLHGQMKAKEKEEAMALFRDHGLDVLVSTTVIEVGVDVANATVMVIEDANRFGLSQLHQLRGRVGRGGHQSYCILISDGKGDEARERMEALVQTTDGFRIAETDLRLRGPGELAGTKQSGNLDFKIADLIQDGRLLEVARQAATEFLQTDPTLSLPEHALLLERVREQRTGSAAVVVS